MGSSFRIGVAGAALLAAAVLAAACSNRDDPDPKQCSVLPAFDLTVRAVSGPLPGDTMIEVEYGGGMESYRVDTGKGEQEVMLCDQNGVDAGDAGSSPMSVHCVLWTQGAATVTVSATGYPTVTEQLTAKAEGKCFETVPVEIVLGDQDAAP